MNVVRCTADARSLVAFYRYKCIMHHADGENNCIALRLESNILDLLAGAQKRKSIIANRFARYLERKRRDRTFFFFFFILHARVSNGNCRFFLQYNRSNRNLATRFQWRKVGWPRSVYNTQRKGQRFRDAD